MTATKKFNWKKAVSIFFGVVVILRILAWLFISPVPKCDETKVMKKLDTIAARELDSSREYDGIFAKFTNGKEVSSDSKSRVCKVTMTLTDDENNREEFERTFDITEKNKDYIIRLR